MCAGPQPSEVRAQSLHDALPFSRFLAAALATGADRLPPGPADAVAGAVLVRGVRAEGLPGAGAAVRQVAGPARSEEHTSELQSREKLVCLPLRDEKKS